MSNVGSSFGVSASDAMAMVISVERWPGGAGDARRGSGAQCPLGKALGGQGPLDSERPVHGLLEQGSEAFDFLPSLREIDGAVSYGVFFCISQSIHGMQASNRLRVACAGMLEGGSMSPNRRQGATKARQRGVFSSLISRRDSRCFNSLNQLQCAGRTASGGGGERRVPDLQADLDRTNSGKRRHQQPKESDPRSPTKLSNAREAGVRRLWLHAPLVHR